MTRRCKPCKALGVRVQVRNFEERSTKASEEAGEAQACAFMELATVGSDKVERFGVGLGHQYRDCVDQGAGQWGEPAGG